MKITNIALGFVTAAAIFVAGCAATSQQGTISEESLGLRKTNLYTEQNTVADKTMYKETPAGSGIKFERSFENAPPMIPHSVEGMIPIKIDNNTCVTCHNPDIAKSMNATPIPKSHFKDYRPNTTLGQNGKIIKEGKVIENTSDVKIVQPKKLTHLAGARFNCTLCHAPQSEGELVKNNFTPDFRNKDTKSASNLSDVINEGVK